MQDIEKPIKRHSLRRYLGREYFILKRRLYWLRNKAKYAIVDHSNILCIHPVKQHQSILLRPLKDVDMYLQYNKVTNLRLAIQHINNVIIKPGQVFSLWKLVGRPTQRKGYLEGLALHNGQIATDIGGGLCQLGNLLYWMALHSDLMIHERWRHSFDVFPDINRTIPFGCGATLAYNYIDLQLINRTQQTYRLHLWLDDEYLHGELLSDHPQNSHFEIIETDHQVRQQSWGGYTRHNRIWQRKTDLRDNTVSKTLVTENHAIMMYNPYLTSN